MVCGMLAQQNHDSVSLFSSYLKKATIQLLYICFGRVFKMGVKATRVVAIPRSVISPSPSPWRVSGELGNKEGHHTAAEFMDCRQFKKKRKSFPPS